MARRDGFLAMVMGLATALLPGCQLPGGATGRPVLDRTNPALPQQAPRDLPPSSPYHAHNPEPPVERPVAHVEEKAAAADLKPVALPGAEPPGPPAPPGPLPLPQPPPDKPVVAALRLMLAKRPAEGIELLKTYDPPSQELLLALLPLAARLGESGLEQLSPQEVAAILDQLQGLETTLRARAALTLDKLCFCSRIDKFGSFQPLPPEHAFQAGHEQRAGERVQVYGQVRNFGSPWRGGAYETLLACSLEIRTFKGEIVTRWDVMARPDRSQTPRQDYFLNIQFHVPPRLPPDTYVLWVQVKDLSDPANPRVARSSLDFHVSRDGPAPAGPGGSGQAESP